MRILLLKNKDVMMNDIGDIGEGIPIGTHRSAGLVPNFNTFKGKEFL